MIEITMDGPGKNSLGTGMMTYLIDRLAEAGGEPVLLTGAGDSFSAGLDLKEVTSLDERGMEAFLRRLDALTNALFHYPGPTVALVNGHAIAGGCVLAVCCDHRVAQESPRARIGLNEVALGLRFPPGVLRMLLARIPRQHQGEVLLGAGLHDPHGALRLGLVDEVTDDAPAVARARLAALAAHPRAAYAATKTDIRSVEPPTAEEERRFAAEVLPAWTSGDVRQRLARAMGK